MAVSLVYLTYLCQFTLDNNANPGARAATAGAVMLIIAQVSLKKITRNKKILHTDLVYLGYLFNFSRGYLVQQKWWR